MIPLKAWNIIQPKKAQQHANRNISMSSCVRQYSTALSHSLIILFLPLYVEFNLIPRGFIGIIPINITACFYIIISHQDCPMVNARLMVKWQFLIHAHLHCLDLSHRNTAAYAWLSQTHLP